MTKTPAQIKEELDALQTQYRETAKARFSEAFPPLFAKWPQLKSISFKCYSVYFNDGDECPFRARYDDDRLVVNGYDYDDQEENGVLNLARRAVKTVGRYSSNLQPNPDYDPAAEQCLAEVNATLSAFDDDIYEVVVGNHVKVTITQDGLTTEDYSEHD